MAQVTQSLHSAKSRLTNIDFDQSLPLVEDLRCRAQKRMPGFAYDYLSGGCNEENNLRSNVSEIKEVRLKPIYLEHFRGVDLSTKLFGHVYEVPFGIAPIGLQALMWPNSPEILAESAAKHNIPFVLSTVSSASIEKIGEITGGKAWFQLYHPAKDELRDDLLKRARDVGMQVLVVTADVPTFGYRPREFRSRLAMPPKMTLRNILQIIGHPRWAVQTLTHGKPHFATIAKYIPEGLSMQQLGQFMQGNFDGRMNPDKLAAIRDRWKGSVVIKGILSEEDAERCVQLGFDGIIVSNHGGRQLDAGEASITALRRLAPEFGHKITIMVDGGLRSGPDIAKAIACGAKFTFMGRPFMYGVAALGSKGGDHTISILKVQLLQILEQLGCDRPENLYRHLVS